MGTVVQLFPTNPQKQNPHVSSAAIRTDIKRMEMRHAIWTLERTVKSFKELADTLINQADKFTARQLAAETQRDLDRKVAEYTGSFGAYVAY